MDISHQFKEIGFFFAENGFVAIFEEMAGPVVPLVEVDSVPGEKLSHERRYAHIPRPDEEVYMVRHERERVKGALTTLYNVAESCKEFLSVHVIDEEIAPVDSTQNNVVERSRCVETGMAWHETSLSWPRRNVKTKRNE
jgi:hypothetical protein